jgi:hypothetical protein
MEVSRPLSILVAGVMLVSCSSKEAVTPEEARAIAKEAYIYGFPMVDNYRILHAYFVDTDNPEFKGPPNQIANIGRVYTPEDKTVQTPNSDTPYSMLGADLRLEPLVLTMPAVEEGRYYSAQFIDLYTFNFAYAGSRATGNQGGTFLLAGPGSYGLTNGVVFSSAGNKLKLAAKPTTFQGSTRAPHSIARPHRFSSIEYGLSLRTLIGMPCAVA